MTTSGSSPAVKGVCRAFFAYDVGLSIDLDAAEQLVARTQDGGAQREVIRHTRRSPPYFQFRPAPLRISRQGASIAVGAWRTTTTVDFVVYDFGSVCVSYTIDVDGPLEELLPLGEALYDNASLLADSRRRVDELARSLASSIGRPHTASVVEDYAVYELGPLGAIDGGASPDFLERHGHALARLLRADRQTLAPQEIQDALASRLSYTPTDLAIIDWNASVLFLQEPEDARCVLEFANVELLEMRHLDDQLDLALDRSYQSLTQLEARRGGVLGMVPRSVRAELRRVAEWEMDNSLLFENVNNALKLLGDQYLARMYRLAADKLHLPDWDGSILRKLRVLESIYAKLNDLHSARRMELLEWIVIILIAMEIVLTLVRH